MNAQNAWTLDTTIQTILSKLGYSWPNLGLLKSCLANANGLVWLKFWLKSRFVTDGRAYQPLIFEMVEWLENYIANYKKSVLVVTYDRYLDQITTHIFV